VPITVKLNVPTRLYLYYPYGDLTAPKVSVYDGSGTLVATRTLVATSENANLYLTTSVADASTSVTLKTLGEYELRYTDTIAEVTSTVSTDTLVVGVNPTPDVDLSYLTKPTFHLEDGKVGNTTSVVKLKLLKGSGNLVDVGTTARATYTGTAAISTFAVNDADALVLKIDGLTSAVSSIGLSPAGETTTVIKTSAVHNAVNGTTVTLASTNSTPSVDGSYAITYISDKSFSITAAAAVTIVGTQGTADAAPAKTATFIAKRATVTGAAGSYLAGAATTTATITIDGKPDQTLTLAAATAGISNYVTAINTQLRGVSCTASGTSLVLSSDTYGTSSKIVLSNLGATFQAYSGLSAGTYTDSTAQNVANADAVTFAEAKAIIEGAVSQVVAGDLLKVTQTSDNRAVLTVQKGATGEAGKLGLTSASTAPKTGLGLTTLGAGATATLGTVSTETLAEYSATSSTYSASVNVPSEAGLYFLLWYDDGVAVSGFGEGMGIQPKLVLQQSSAGLTAVKLNVGYRADASSAIAPHASTSVLVTRKSSNLAVASSITDSLGRAKFDLEPGEYYTTFKKSGLVFSSNNLLLTVGSESVNVYTVSVPYLKPTYPLEKSLGIEVCELYATLSQLDGTPLRDTEVLVSLKEGPKNISAIGTFGPAKTYKTDKNGRVTFNAVRGAKVEVTIMSVSLTRTFSVPSETVAITSSTMATSSLITASAKHGLTTGDKAVISGHSVATLNKEWEVTVVSTTEFAIPHQPASAGTGGTVLVSSANLLSLMSDAPDVFDIIKLNVPAAPRRSL
jgi:hypothetical protein